MSLTELFNLDDRGWYRKRMKEHFNNICAAINKDNTPEIEKLFANTPGMKQEFLDKYAKDLLKLAMNRGKLETFIPVYVGVGKSPNIEFISSYDHSTSPILCEAISLRKVHIAAYIAKDPLVDITKTRKGETAYDMAKAITDKGEGMEEVVSVLSERIAFMKTKEAEVLLEKAKAEADGLLAQADRLRGQRTGPSA